MIIKTQDDLVIFSFQIVLCSSVCISLSVSTACFDPPGHSPVWMGTRFLPDLISEESFKPAALSHSALAPLSSPPKKKLCELDWRSHNLDRLQDIFGKCHSRGFTRVNLGEKKIHKKRLRFSFLFPPLRLQSLPPWWMCLLFQPLLSPLLLLSFLQIVLTSEKADSMWLSVSDLAPHFPLFPQRFSNNARLHVRWPVTALLEGGGRTRGGAEWLPADTSVSADIVLSWVYCWVVLPWAACLTFNFHCHY